MGKKKFTFSEIKNRIEERFGKDAFSFDEKEYVNTITKMHFTCNKCGNVIFTEPSMLLRKLCCPACRPKTTRKWTVESLKNKFRERHGEKYGYDAINKYLGVDAKYKIFCPEHGYFEQTAYAHMRGDGCPRCKADRAKRGLYGVAVNDSKERISIKGKVIQSYVTWKLMLERCYSIKKNKNLTYRDCSVCDEWLFFSNFKKWFDDPENGYIEGYQIDKDLLVENNRVYSPETCCFIPNLINSQIKKYTTKQHGCTTGVYYRERDGKYTVSHTFDGKNNYLGVFDTLQEAQDAYKHSKENCIKSTAKEMYKNGKITKRVYDALMKYKVTS